jgi:hypothetical protein
MHNKQDEYEVITRNKVRLVAEGYSQVKGLDFDETFAPVARIESIHILLAYDTHHGFKLEGPEKATRGGMNVSQSKFLDGSWPIFQN